ncbi:MAG: J domain-containing protein, partial [Myxococcota bacterium]
TPDPYATLGVSRTATTAEIRRAWRAIAKSTHPDRFPGDADKEREFKEAAAAWTLLSNPTDRAKYDRAPKRPQWTTAHTDAARRAAQQVLADAEEVAQVLFDAILPVFIEAFDRGVGAELVWQLAHALQTNTLLDQVQKAARPGFAARQRSGTLRQHLRIRLDTRALHGADGTPCVATLTQVSEREIRWAAITIWVGSFESLGVTDAPGRKMLLLTAMTRELVRSLEADLPPKLRPIALGESTPIGTDQKDFRAFRAHDTRHLTWTTARIAIGLAAVVVLIGAVGWVLTGSIWWRSGF